MKKSVFNLTVICLLAYSVTSCGKSSVSKMSNKWNVTSYIQTTIINFSLSSTEKSTSNSIEYLGSDSDGNIVSTISGVINENTFTINKNGTWKSTKDFTIADNNGINDNVTQTVITKSGTWSFVGSNKKEDFKKNDRVVFYTLFSQEINYITPTSGSATDTTSKSDSYKMGGPSITYTIIESSYKKLILFFDSENDISDGNNSVSKAYNSEMTLEQK